MTEPTEAMKAMAARIMREVVPQEDYAARGIAYDASLAAIIETQRADAELADTFGDDAISHGPALTTRRRLAQAIRTGNHYGKDESNGN